MKKDYLLLNRTLNTMLFFRSGSLMIDADCRPAGEGDEAVVREILEGVLEHVASDHLKQKDPGLKIYSHPHP